VTGIGFAGAQASLPAQHGSSGCHAHGIERKVRQMMDQSTAEDYHLLIYGFIYNMVLCAIAIAVMMWFLCKRLRLQWSLLDSYNWNYMRLGLASDEKPTRDLAFAVHAVRNTTVILFGLWMLVLLVAYAWID
jgi:hypothetical protein